MKKTHFVAFVTGGLRSGKGLFAIRCIEDFALRRCRIVTNYDLYLENLLPHSMRNVNVIRIPDRPNVADLELIGQGYESDNPLDYDEAKFGLIVLDELGAWMNSRSWNEKGRKEVIDWLLHSGKRRWSLLLTIQDLDMLDSQFKAATASQLVVKCWRLGDMPIPFITPIVKLITGYHLTLPDTRLAVVKAGFGVTADRIFYKGTRFFNCYNTRQEFYPRDHPDCASMYSYLSPWHLKGRYKTKKDWQYFKRWLNQNVHVLLFIYLATAFAGLVSFAASALSFQTSNEVKQSVSALQSTVSALPVSTSSLPVQAVNCEVFNSQFSNFRILGTTLVNGGATSYSYLFLDGVKAETYTTERLALMGFAVRNQGKCSALIIKNSCYAEVSCDTLKPDKKQ